MKNNKSMNDDHCFIQINRNYLEALRLRRGMLEPARAANIDYMLSEIETAACDLHKNFLTTTPGEFVNTVSNNALEQANDFLRVSGIKGATGKKPTTEQEVVDGYFDWVIVTFFDKLQGAIIKTTNVHDELMANTDIDKVPLCYLKPPYQAIYFQFNEGIDFRSTELNISGKITGAYMLSRIVDNKLSMQTMLVRKDNKNEEMHYASDAKQIDLNEPDGIISGVDDLYAFKSSDTELEATFNKVYSMIFKTILYMGLKDARIREVNIRDDYEKKLMSVKAKKAKKIAAKVNYKYNYILVGSEDDSNRQVMKTVVNQGDRVMPVHWRRGHLRNQKYGHNLQSSHLIWIQPTLINQKLVTDKENIKPKDYIVGG